MEYNTKRTQLKINDYGRNIYKLIQYAKHIEDRDKRNQTAAAIVDIMARIGGEGKGADVDKRKYWVHLMILANWKLDVDVPYEISPEETVEFKPRQLKYNANRISFRHYGNVMERMVQRVAEYPKGEEREALTGMLAHAMKRDYLLWNRDTVENEIIDYQLDILSEGRLQVNHEFQYKDVKEYLKGTDDERSNNGNRKKKKKK